MTPTGYNLSMVLTRQPGNNTKVQFKFAVLPSLPSKPKIAPYLHMENYLMASTRVTLTADTWTQLTTTDKDGQVKHLTGKQIVYTESNSMPVGFDGNTPVSETTRQGDFLTYYRIASTDFLWAYSIGEDADITVTPAG